MADKPQRYIVMKAEALDEIMMADIKAMLNNDESAIHAYNKCVAIINQYLVSPEDILGKEDNENA